MEAPPPVKMSVEGKGVVTLAPDVVTVSVGVRNDHATATGALAANNSAMTRVTAKVREHAREEDVKTRYRRESRYARRKRRGRALTPMSCPPPART